MEYTPFLLLFFVARAFSDDVSEGEPRMASTPSNLRVMEGSSVLLPCNVFNLGESDVRVWRKLPSRTLFSGSINVSSDAKISIVDKTSLHIENITSEYSGEYMCLISMRLGISVTHKILVLVPPSIVMEPSHGKVIVRRGSSAKMKCNAMGVPKPTLTWTYEIDGKQVSSLPSGVRQVQESQLQVTSVDSHHSGHYQCTAENDVGHPAIAVFNLTVLYTPEVTVKPDWIHGDEGATVEFACTAKSAPLSHVVWIRGDPKEGRHLVSGDQIKVREKVTQPTTTESWLKIQRMRKEDLGSYTCMAKNTVGQTWKTVEVSGLAEAVQLRGNASGEESFLLLWTAKSYSPIIEYQLKIRKFKNGDEWTDVVIPVEGTQPTIFYSQAYNVTGLQAGQRYEAVLQAHNDYGWNRPSDSFFFRTGTILPEIEESENENMMLTTLPLYDADLEIKDPVYSSGMSICRRIPCWAPLIVFLLLL